MLDLIVNRITKETDNVVRLELVKADGGALPIYQAGAHIELQLPSGKLRQYSLCRLPTSGKEFEIAVLREPSSRGGSDELHRLKVGDTLQSKLPQNHFLLSNPQASALLMAAGIGITPLIPMAQMLAKSGADFKLHYSAKSSKQAAFYDTLKAAPFADKVAFHFTQEQGQRADIRALLAALPDKRDIYVCGPNDYIHEVLDTARELGWPEARLHREFFKVQRSPEIDSAPREAFQVKLASTGEVFDVEKGLSITQTLELNGIEIPISCEEGWCGTCMTRVLEGIPDHRDTFLSDDERRANNLIMPCCSRSRSDCLVLDI
ncbi:Ferredoxin-NADP reductase [Marinomonas fungiae]|uniref:Ferredoxin-NADP reductase n=2 Tax=Marinomonas fungiae TaxID=1137284 RepID=A0A0K6IJ37_9GAMM|nr:Ferredoxin-NADP reductase [Marinomonas fungiae]